MVPVAGVGLVLEVAVRLKLPNWRARMLKPTEPLGALTVLPGAIGQVTVLLAVAYVQSMAPGEAGGTKSTEGGRTTEILVWPASAAVRSQLMVNGVSIPSPMLGGRLTFCGTTVARAVTGSRLSTNNDARRTKRARRLLPCRPFCSIA
ncbi:hypothetical protein D3C71_1421500 [compost metagenome]